MNNKIDRLIAIAKEKMEGCRDPMHDLAHVQRVIAYTECIKKDFQLTERQLQGLVLAAWWHDVSRTITRNPSLIWMPFVDDIISAIMLWFATIKEQLFGNIVALSTRVILCKSIGAGALLTKLLLSKRDRIVLDILRDADTLDALNPERAKNMQLLAEQSRRYKLAYRLVIWWYVATDFLELKTEAAKKFLEQLFRDFLEWITGKENYLWHLERFGEKWCCKNKRRAELRLLEMTLAAE